MDIAIYCIVKTVDTLATVRIRVINVYEYEYILSYMRYSTLKTCMTKMNGHVSYV
jgi:hypothetical protein